MANLRIDYDPATVAPGGDFELMPEHECPMQIVASDVADNSKGSGLLLTLQWELMDGPYVHRIVYEPINYKHDKSPKAQLIGQQRLLAICEAIGHTGKLEDSEILHYRPVLGKVNIKRATVEDKNNGYSDKNVIGRVKSLAQEESAPAVAQAEPARQQRPATVPAPTATQAAPAPGSRPWKRNAVATA